MKYTGDLWSADNESANGIHPRSIPIRIETSTRLKSRDSRASRKGKYLKRTRASLQQADPCRYSPRVADGRSSRHGLSLSFAWLSSILRTKLSRCHRPEACVLYLQPKEWFLPPVPDQLVFWETMVYWIFRQDLPFIRIRNMPDETVRRPSSSLRSIWKKYFFWKIASPEPIHLMTEVTSILGSICKINNSAENNVSAW